ncbi:MAG: Maf family nucleotide pyrophosphatase [Bacteroidales bacterium]|jgi:septum formation protein|nr:Maf family nucleotide pyrophosphatase [Bacteroidales bacterium]
MWNSDLTIVLASNSPRRKQLIEAMDFRLETISPSDSNEDYPADLPFEQIPIYLAQKKMHSLHYQKPLHNKVLLTADTIVFLNGKPLGKPQNESQARQMLNDLSDNEHLVITGCCLKTDKAEYSFSDRSLVAFAPLTEEEISYYISKHRPFDKAGSYGIQDWIGLTGIERIEGSYYNVMGLPCQKVYQTIRNMVLRKPYE